MNTKNWILFLSLLINFCLFLYIFSGIKNNNSPDFKGEIDSLKSDIKVIELEKKILEFENDSLQKRSNSLFLKLSLDRTKIINTIEYRDKKDTIIKTMLDGELLELFSKFDSLNYKNK